MAVEALAAVEDAVEKSLADVAYERILDRLLMLDIKPGDPLNDEPCQGTGHGADSGAGSFEAA